MARDDLPAEGSTVELSYTPSGRPFSMGRQTVTATIEDVMGDIVYLDNPFGNSDPTLVVDPDDDLYARSEDGRDGLYGTNVRFE